MTTETNIMDSEMNADINAEINVDETGFSSLVESDPLVKMETPFEGKRKPSQAKMNVITPHDEKKEKEAVSVVNKRLSSISGVKSKVR